MKKLDISIIGAGKIVQNYHLPLLRNIQELNVTKIYDTDQPLNEKVAKLYNLKSCKNIEDTLDSDIFLIATPVQFRNEYYYLLLNKNKSMFIEKPLTISSASHEMLLKKNDENSSTIYLGLMRRYLKSVQMAIQLLQNNFVGKCIKIKATEGKSPNGQKLGIDNFHYQNSRYGNVLLETGVHLIDEVFYILEVEKFTIINLTNNKASDFIYDTELDLELLTSKNEKIPCNFKISYTKTLCSNIIFYCENGEIILKNDNPNKILIKKNNIIFEIDSNKFNKFASNILEAFYLEWLDFLNCYNKRKYDTNPINSLNVTKLIEEASANI